MPRPLLTFVAAATLVLTASCTGRPEAAPSRNTSGPRLLLDQAHHNAHTVDRQLAALYHLLQEAGARTELNDAALTPETLAPYDVLLLPTPRGASREATLDEKARPAFTAEEIETVHAWVRDGGGLWVLSEHAPIGESLRALLSRFGVENSGGFLEDSAQGGWETRTLLFTREDGSFGEHPIFDGRDPSQRVERIMTFLGESLQGPAGSTALLKLSDTAQDRYLQREGRVWRDPSPEDRIVPARGRSQAIAFTLGKGRVVIFGETGLFTAQGLGADAQGPGGAPLDNGRLAVNVLRWLGGEP